MDAFLAYTIVGIVTGAIYAVTASGLVVTYTTSGVFNFAHGAIGMVMAFTYWELTVKDGLPEWLGLLIVLGVLAPLLGALLERLLMRQLHGATVSTQLVVTLAVLLALIGLASIRWSPTEPRVLPQFFEGHQVGIFGVNVTYHQLVMVGVAVLVAAFLRLLFYRTRLGIAMRAVVDDPELAGLNGADPDRVSMASWAIGAQLAALAGILLAPLVTLDIILLTLLVINGYAAAMVGRLKSLPLTFAGGLALGLAESYTIKFLPTNMINKVRPGLPIIFLYVVLLILPQARLRAGRLVSSRKVQRVASARESLVGSIALVLVGLLAAQFLDGSWMTVASAGMVWALIMLSLVLLVGYAGQVSLCQMTFVGLGAFAMGKWFGGGSLLGIVAAAALAGVIGAIAALPALRLTGLYLGLSTLAFAQAMTVMFFKDERVLGYGGRLPVGRPSILGLSFESDKSFFILLCIVFAIAAAGVLALRRGRFGRRIVAMKDSPAACATLGLNLTFTKLAVFAVSSALAGVAGCFYGALRGQVGSNDFEMLNSLVLLMLVTVSGINTVTGALAGGLTFGLFPKIQTALPESIGRNFSYLGAGLGGIGVARNPNGWTSELSPIGDLVRRILRVDPAANGDSTIDLRDREDAQSREEMRELAGTAS
ncbi:MAG: amino acid/amide transporter rane protein 2, family / amino acid/amide transporter [Actinomycetia bacterium]|nr:amino acid/amide transporter rane protein 2, family / amino acid/amide transporter [Actinomycetes bacterium]